MESPPPASRPAGPRPARTAVLVLGMHRSGTSAITRVLALHGLALPARMVKPGHDNPLGFWESQAVVDVNKRLLARLARRYDDPRPVRWALLPAEAREPFIAEAAAALAEEFPGDAPFILKEPRLCRLLPVWLPAIERLGATPAVLLPVRNPLEVAQSLLVRNRIGTAQGLLLWLGHVLAAERDSRHLPRAVVHYDDLLADWRGLLAQLGVAFRRETALETEAFLSPALRHHEAGTDALLRDPGVPAPIKRVYAELRRAPAESGLDPAPFDAAAAWFEEVTADPPAG
ncbi:sulfotransferase family protein [Falsiroseomonas selenitidurans]|uniref:Sulfotransferase family protein n=1 Tax=Falsiroseomonas selenitidurans TaxID=2716335 RepID=A0ABX1E0Q1_9PROT|nr:hypothetical protein [Falsiroseomonas selenitidurans]NKC30729.1 hypothetical protein [Falsiroseomonas selenitidurans]